MKVFSRGQTFENKMVWLQNVYMQKVYNAKCLHSILPNNKLPLLTKKQLNTDISRAKQWWKKWRWNGSQSIASSKANAHPAEAGHGLLRLQALQLQPHCIPGAHQRKGRSAACQKFQQFHFGTWWGPTTIWSWGRSYGRHDGVG